MSGAFQHCFGVLLQALHIALSGRTIQHACLTETASADTSSLNFQNDTVLCCFDERNDRGLWIRCFGYVQYHLFFDHRWCMLVVRCKGSKRSVFMVCGIVKHRHIQSFDLCGAFQKFDTALSCCPILFIGIQQFVVDSLPFSDIENIKKFCQWFRIIRTWTSSDNDWICLTTVTTVVRNPA